MTTEKLSRLDRIYMAEKLVGFLMGSRFEVGGHLGPHRFDIPRVHLKPPRPSSETGLERAIWAAFAADVGRVVDWLHEQADNLDLVRQDAEEEMNRPSQDAEGQTFFWDKERPRPWRKGQTGRQYKQGGTHGE